MYFYWAINLSTGRLLIPVKKRVSIVGADK